MKKSLVVLPLVAVSGLCLTAGDVAAAPAAPRAKTTVTIEAQGTDLSGTVRSPKPRQCANNRKVIVIKQQGARGGGDDTRFATDTASLEGGVYRWSTGTTGTPGRFYAKVRRTPNCAADTSPTIRATR